MINKMVRSTNSPDLLTFVLLQIILTSMIIEQGEAIQCFVCNSKSDPRCADPIQTDWSPDEQDSNDSNERNDGDLEPVECHLAVQYSTGIQAISDLLRGFGHARLGVPDLWVSTLASLSANSGSGFSGSSGGGHKGGYGGKGYRGSSPWGIYGGHREQEESMGCHKVTYTESSGDSVVDRGCAPARVANMDPCSALDSATSGNDNGNSGSIGSSGSSSGYGGGHGVGGGSAGTFDLSQITADFCEVCNDADGCNGATNISINSLFVLVLSLLYSCLKIL